jgi:hypothetical protein
VSGERATTNDPTEAPRPEVDKSGSEGDQSRPSRGTGHRDGTPAGGRSRLGPRWSCSWRSGRLAEPTGYPRTPPRRSRGRRRPKSGTRDPATDSANGPVGLRHRGRCTRRDGARPIFDQCYWFPESRVLAPAWIQVYTCRGVFAESEWEGAPVLSFHWQRPYTVFDVESLVPILLRLDGVTVGRRI